ncbi:hypothetical protein ABIB35_000967 [Arthrobacter sp. UYP6]|uniref:hypothetical protein n=1 Tax=Arthrobacter sp. UYP6 TaxID=1756378 RepID=UPI0033999E29
MEPALILKYIILTCVTLGIAGLARWARKHPNRSKEHPERVRVPKIVPIIGWLFLTVGLLMGLLSLATPDMPLGAHIAAWCIFAGGMFFLVMYRNFYIVPGAHEVAFRTAVFGSEHVLPYSDIARYSLRASYGQQILSIKSIHGTRLSVNIRTFDVAPLLRAIDYHQVTGRWPDRVEVTRQTQPGRGSE